MTGGKGEEVVKQRNEAPAVNALLVWRLVIDQFP